MPDIPAEDWSAPWIASDTCCKHQAEQAEIDLRDWLAGKPHEAFDALKAVLSPISPTDDMTFLEIGSGCGYNAAVFLMTGQRQIYHGLDISLAMVEYANKQFGHIGKFSVGSAESLPFSDGSMDCTCLAAVIQHMPDYRPAIREAIRVSNRSVILHRVQATRGETNEFVNEAYSTKLPTRELNEDELLSFCESAGLKLVHAHRWGDVSKAFNASFLFEKS
jgi:SAM-dependent methyltransferase